jgi:hypothetical protein
MTGYPPCLIRKKRRLISDPTFDVNAVYPLTIFQLGAEKKADGSVLEQMRLEAHRLAGLQVEHLRVNDWLEFRVHVPLSAQKLFTVTRDRKLCRALDLPDDLRAEPLSDFVRMQITDPWVG